MGKKNKATIEKIYICRTLEGNPDLIEKILIQYSDEDFSYSKLSSFYNEMDPTKQEEEKNKILNKLDSYIKRLLEQDNLNDMSETEKIINVDVSDIELKKYVDDQIKKVDCEYSRMCECLCTLGGLCSLLAANYSVFNVYTTMHNSLMNSIVSLFNSFVSVSNFRRAIKSNKERKLLGEEKLVNRKLKLFFSYFMISFNIGLNILNLSVNYEKINNDITLVKSSSIEVDNPFADDDSYLLVNSPDEASALVMEAFKQNTLLNDKDLEIALSLKQAIEDNPYVDYEQLYETFATIGVMHYKDVDNGTIAADYNRLTNSINVYSSSYLSDEFYVDALAHEFFHSTGNLDNTLLNEGMTSLLQMEYSDDVTVNDSYYDHVLFAKIFCELITPEKMLEAYTKDDMSIIKNEMLKLCPDERAYNNLMDAMEYHSENYKDIHYSLNNSLYGKFFDEIDADILDVSEYPNVKFHMLLEPFLYSESLTYETREQINKYISKIGFWNDVPDKVYFNKKLKIFNEEDGYSYERSDGAKVYVIKP